MPPTTTESATRNAVKGVVRAYDAQIDSVDQDDRSLVAKINTAGLDRFKTVIDPRGGRFDNYRRNAVVLWEHGKDPRRFTDPIGRNLWLRTNGREKATQILAKTRFLDDDFSQQRYEWYRDGVLNAFSVNVLPDADDASPPTREEIRARPELSDCTMVYRAWDLAEYSGTTVPGNADCLTGERAHAMLAAVERGLWIPDDLMPVIEAKAHEVPATATEESPATIMPEPRSAPWIEDGKGVWIVRAADGSVVLSSSDEAVAAQCFNLINAQTTSFESAYHRVIQENRTMFSDFKSDIQALVDLMLHGKV